jgi:hypothetical protein
MYLQSLSQCTPFSLGHWQAIPIGTENAGASVGTAACEACAWRGDLSNAELISTQLTTVKVTGIMYSEHASACLLPQAGPC